MTRAAAIAAAERYFDEGGFVADLGRRVAIPTESQVEARAPVLRAYLADEIAPSCRRLGFASEIVDNPVDGGGPVLIAERREAEAATDRVRLWPRRRDPRPRAAMAARGCRRGSCSARATGSTAAAPPTTRASTRSTWRRSDCVLKTRGRLGFNAMFLIETGEEIGSPGLREVCRAIRGPARRRRADRLGRAAPRAGAADDLLGARGAMNFDLIVDLREGGHHSGNWGGLLANPGVILAHALATITTPEGRDPGARVGADDICRTRCAIALADCTVEGGADAPDDRPGLGRARPQPEREGLRLVQLRGAGLRDRQPGEPGQRDPAAAPRRHCQIRFVVGVDPEEFLPALRRHLDAHGFPMVQDRALEQGVFRGDPARPRSSLGALGRGLDRARPPARRRRSCRTSAARCRTTSSPTISACRRSGSRIPTPRARSTRRTSTCWRRSAREALE